MTCDATRLFCVGIWSTATWGPGDPKIEAECIRPAPLCRCAAALSAVWPSRLCTYRRTRRYSRRSVLSSYSKRYLGTHYFLMRQLTNNPCHQQDIKGRAFHDIRNELFLFDRTRIGINFSFLSSLSFVEAPVFFDIVL